KPNASYPSGHTTLGWSSALLLSEVNPAKADTLMARGHMYGDSRLIVGAHWQSDVDAARLAASAAYAHIHNSARFQEQMRKAKEEFARLSEQAVSEGDGLVDALPLQKMEQSSARVYRLDGTPATKETRGIVIEQGAKKVRR
ncbi:MAG: phosphatase PAP2 family protein, partial [Prevotella sp.]|nr:phosphatase PAP2 family protein [Prevotella sp.]